MPRWAYLIGSIFDFGALAYTWSLLTEHAAFVAPIRAPRANTLHFRECGDMKHICPFAPRTPRRPPK